MNIEKTILKVFMLMFFTTPLTALSEEKICFPSPCADVEKHLDYSRDNSVAAVVGSFVVMDKHSITELDGPGGKRKYLDVQFLPSAVKKGKGLNKPFNVKLPIEKLIPQNITAESTADEDLLKTWVNTIKGKNFSKAPVEAYEKLEGSIVNKLSAGNGKSSANLAAVKVAFGGLDYSVRKATVPVFEGQEYIVFLFKDVSGDNPFLFPWDFNIYSHDAYKLFEGT